MSQTAKQIISPNTNSDFLKNKWWGQYQLLENQIGNFQIGPLNLFAKHLKHEWQLGFNYAQDTISTNLKITIPAKITEFPKTEYFFRYSFNNSLDTITLSPILADRPVITKPITPFFILPDEETTVFVSSPLWVQVSVNKKSLDDFPIARPTDTWFGPSTLEGELCYSTLTSCRLDLNHIPIRSHRATTAVKINNHSGKKLELNSLNIPAPYLSLYQTDNGNLWTNSVILNYKDKADLSELEFTDTLPKKLSPKIKICEPRKQIEKNTLLRSITNIF